MDNEDGCGLVILIAFIFSIIVIFVSFMDANSKLKLLKAQAVELNYARYTNDVYGVTYFVWNDCCTTNNTEK